MSDPDVTIPEPAATVTPEAPAATVTQSSEALGRRSEDVAVVAATAPSAAALAPAVAEHDSMLSDLFRRLRQVEERLGL